MCQSDGFICGNAFDGGALAQEALNALFRGFDTCHYCSLLKLIGRPLPKCVGWAGSGGNCVRRLQVMLATKRAVCLIYSTEQHVMGCTKR